MTLGGTSCGRVLFTVRLSIFSIPALEREVLTQQQEGRESLVIEIAEHSEFWEEQSKEGRTSEQMRSSGMWEGSEI